MPSYPKLKYAGSAEECRAIYHMRNSWVLFAFIPLMCGLVSDLAVLTFEKILSYILLIIIICFTVYVQGYGHTFYDGLRGLISNSVAICVSWLCISFDLYGSNRMCIAYAFATLMTTTLCMRAWDGKAFVICFIVMCISAPNFAMLLCCHLLVICISPFGDYLSRVLRYYFVLLRLFIIPVAFLSLDTFIRINKFIYVPILVLIVVTAIALGSYIKSYFKRRFAR